MSRSMLLTAVLAALLANVGITLTNTLLTGSAKAAPADPLRQIADSLARLDTEQLRSNAEEGKDDLDEMLRLTENIEEMTRQLLANSGTSGTALGAQFVKMNATLSQILAELRRRPSG